MNYPLLALSVLLTSIAVLVVARLTGRFLISAVAGVAIVLYLHGAVYLNYTSDDAYISYRYALHLADGIGLVWNPGQHVEGYSNFLWVLILAGSHVLGADIPLSGRWIGFASAVAASAMTYLLVEELLLRKDVARYAGMAAAIALAASAPFALWSYAGLETPFFALLVAVAVLLHIREQRSEGVPASGVVWALVLFTRPDGVVLFVVSAFFKVAEVILAEGRADAASRQRSPASRRRLALWLVAFSALFVPYFAWRYVTYGWLLPNAYYAKVGGGSAQFERGLRYLIDFSRQYAAWLILLVAPALMLNTLRRSAAIYMVALLTAWGIYVVLIGGDALLDFRFFAEVLPLLYAVAAASLASILLAIRFEEPRAALLRSAAGIVVTGGLIAFTLQSTPNEPYSRAVPNENAAVRDRVVIGRWLRANAPRDTSIAVLAAGAIPYESRLVTIDMLGLNDEHIAHRPIRVGAGAAGHEKFDAQYVLSLKPTAIILFDALESGPVDRAEYERRLRVALTPAAAEMVGNASLWLQYEPRTVNIDGRWFNLLVRKDSSLMPETDVIAK